MGFKWLVFILHSTLYWIRIYAVRWGSKGKHHKETCLKEIGLHTSSNANQCSTFDSQHKWEDLYMYHLKNRQTCISSSDMIEYGEVWFSIWFFCTCFFFIIDLLMQTRVLLCVNLINRSWRTWRTNPSTPTYLTHTHIQMVLVYMHLQTHAQTYIHIHKVGPLYATFTICLEMRVVWSWCHAMCMDVKHTNVVAWSQNDGALEKRKRGWTDGRWLGMSYINARCSPLFSFVGPYKLTTSPNDFSSSSTSMKSPETGTTQPKRVGSQG